MDPINQIEGTLNTTSKSIVTISYSNKLLGVACFLEISNTIFADEIYASVDDIGGVLLNIKLNLAPTMFIVHPQIIGNKSLLDLILTGPDGSNDYYSYQSLKTACWNVDTAMDIITNKLRIRNHDRNNSLNNYIYLLSLISINGTVLRQVLGALLLYMEINQLQLRDGMITVAEIKSLPQQNYLHIDASTRMSLQIFAEEAHPNVIKSTSSRSKEGFSLFGMFDRTRSALGRQQLRSWMMRPFCDVERINFRLNGVSLVAGQRHKEMIVNIVKLLRKVHDTPRILLRIKKAEAISLDWCRLQATLEASLNIGHLLAQFVAVHRSGLLPHPSPRRPQSLADPSGGGGSRYDGRDEEEASGAHSAFVESLITCVDMTVRFPLLCSFVYSASRLLLCLRRRYLHCRCRLKRRWTSHSGKQLFIGLIAKILTVISN